MNPDAPPLSVAMIIRDEGEFLSSFFVDIESLGAEIVVVDTGSIDKSPQIAAEHGGIVLHFPWCDDFAAARNVSLEHCTGRWILCLDADERLTAQDVKKISEIIQTDASRAYRLTTLNYTDNTSIAEFQHVAPGDPDARGFAGWFPSVKIRLFPNHPDIRFEGAVHETVHAAVERLNLPILMSDVVVHHYAALRGAARQKSKREFYLRLGEAKLAVRPGDAQAHAELGDQLAELGDYAAAVKAYRNALQLDPANARNLKELGAVLFLAGRPAEARKALELAVARAPHLADAWRNLGILHAQAGAWADAARCFRASLEHGPPNADACRGLALALEQTGHLAEAVDHARRAAELAPANEEAARLYAAQMRGLGRAAQARAFFEAQRKRHGALAAIAVGMGLLEAQ